MAASDDLDPTARPVLVALAWVCVAAEALWLAAGWTLAPGPTMPVLPSAPVALVALAVVAAAHPRRPGAHAPAVALAAVLAVVGAAAVVGAGWAAALELALASAAEEGVYRLALPVAVASALRAAGVADGAARSTAVAVACAGFVLLPGHLQQVADLSPTVLLSLVLTSALLGWLAWSSHAFVAVAVAHAAINLALLPVEAGAWPPAGRPVALAAALLATTWLCHARRTPAATRTPVAAAA